MKRILIITLLSVWVGIGLAQEEISVELPGGSTMEFVWIEPGMFTMGASSAEAGPNVFETPPHEVTLSQGFYLGKYEVTQEQWERVMDTHPWMGRKQVQENPNHPAVYISWNTVQEFIQRLNETAGDSLYRLPTEAEWEYACRAGTTTRWSFGNDESQLTDYAWYKDNAWDLGLNYAQPVGTKRPNPWGLYDMHGNVWEWCQDGYNEEYYQNSPRVDPTGPTTGFFLRSLRGGGVEMVAKGLRSSQRSGEEPSFSRGFSLGARLLRNGPKITVTMPQSWGQIKDRQRIRFP